MSATSQLVVPNVAGAADPQLSQNGLEQAAHSEANVAEARKLADQLLGLDPTNLDTVEAARASIETMGAGLASKAAAQSKMLDTPLVSLMKSGDDGGVVAQSLIDLKMQVEELDPARFEFESGWLMRHFGKVPGIGSPVKRYFTRYQLATGVIENIITSLEKGRDQLKRDNVTLGVDQKRMREVTLQLQKVIAVMMALDARLTEALDQEIPSDDPRHAFLKEEIVFPLRQAITDRSQNLLVHQQGVLTMELIIRNNKELIRGVTRSVETTVAALEIAVVLSVALANQRIVLDKITGVNTVTENLLVNNAKRLKTTGVQIQKQASSSSLSIEKLASSFSDIREALDDLSRYRQQALPTMAENILKMDRMAAEQEDEIKKIENALKAKASMKNTPAGNFTLDISE